jgi:hypothetical protein
MDASIMCPNVPQIDMNKVLNILRENGIHESDIRLKRSL